MTFMLFSTIPGLQMEEICKAFLDGYKKAPVKQMLRFRLDRDPKDVVRDGPKPPRLSKARFLGSATNP